MNKKEKKPEKKLTPEELLSQLRAILTALQMKNKMGQLVETHQIKKVKKEIARLLTQKKSNKNNTMTFSH